MYMSEISKSKVSGLKAQKIIILLKLKHVSAISEHPVFGGLACELYTYIYDEIMTCSRLMFDGTLLM